MGNLAVFCLWSVAKPNYYVPCLPGMAVLIGAAWVELAQAGRGPAAARRPSRLEGFCRHSGSCFSWRRWWRRWSCGIGWIKASGRGACSSGCAIAIAVALSAHSWRRGATSLALAPLATACVFGFLVAYGRIAPQENPARGHRALAERLGRIVSGGSPTVMFFNEIDEGLWFDAARVRSGAGARQSSPVQHSL